MRKTVRFLVISVVIIFFFSGFLGKSLLYGEEKDLMNTALQELNIQKADFRFTDNGIERTYGKDPYRLPFFNNQLKNPLGTPGFLQSTSNYIASHPTFHDLIWMGSYRLGYQISSYPEYEPDLSYRIVESAPLLYAIAEIYAVNGKPLQGASFAYLKKQTEKVPLDLQKQVAMICYASIEFKGYRDSAFQGIPEIDLVKAFRNPSAILTDEIFDTLTYNISSKMNYGSLFFGGVLLGKTIDNSIEEIKKLVIPPDLAFNFTTPMGRIILNGDGDDTYTEKEILLSLDAGGNDKYLNGGGGNSTWFNPVSTVIDCGGNDTYETTDDTIYSQGAGVFGMGVLVDLAGDDIYSAKCYAQGFSAFGIGILDDRGGNDSYSSKFLSQGSSMFGIAYLSDREGSDKFEMYTYGQGFGYVRGFGCLFDTKGDDTYIANDSDIAGDNPQSTEHNTSFCQGAGFGRRADLAEGNSISGGFGLLIDLEGNDQYSCGVFGQGTGYWAGTGYLYDREGNDTYKGVWYVQGGAAHFGIGALFDDSGDDTYDALLNMAQGAGHDLSLGFLIDKSGNDVYTSPNLALGGGNDNGIGIFLDNGGDDMYQLRSAGAINLGKANYSTALFGSWRDPEFCVGIFIDHGGKDSYKVLDKEGKPTINDDRAKENTIWSFHQDKAPKSMGCGIDSEDGSLPGGSTMNIGDMFTTDILILAGGDAPDWYEGEPKVANKCLIPILGKPMITYILETLKAFTKPHKTILLGTQSLIDAKVDLLADQFILTPSTNKLSDNIRAGLKACTSEYIVILTGDTPALSLGALDDLYQSIETFPKKDLLVFVVTKPDVDLLFPGSKRTYGKIKEGLAKVGNAMILHQNAIPKLDPLIDTFTINRKSVFKLAFSFGIWNIIKLFLLKSLSLPELEKALLKSTGLDAKAILFPHGEIAVDLDKASDYSDLETYLRRQ